MASHNEFPKRRSNRLKGYDYSLAGMYFVTMVTQNREMLFGRIQDGEMRLNMVGVMVRDEWVRTEKLRPNVSLDEFVIMPNHVHGILVIYDVGADRRSPEDEDPMVGADRRPPEKNKQAHISAPLRRKGNTLGSIIAGFKSAATKKINQHRGTPGKKVWQRNYYDRIIRDETELDRARAYINANVLMWAQDEENPNNVK